MRIPIHLDCKGSKPAENNTKCPFFRTPKSNAHKFEEGSPILYEKHTRVIKGAAYPPDHEKHMVGI